MKRFSEDDRRNGILLDFARSAARSPVTVLDLVRVGTSLLSKAGVCCENSMGSHHLDAKYLTFFGLGLPCYEDSYLPARVTHKEVLEVLPLFEERIRRRVPAQYVTREAYYHGYYFYVDERVLVPRSMMADSFEKILSEVRWETESVLDLCCGSGCIGISLALRRASLRVDLADVSEGALDVAKRNIERFGLGDRVSCVRGDLYENVGGPYSLIISNPPYVASAECPAQAPEYLNEPRLAVDGGAEGRDVVDAVLAGAQDHLAPKGMLVVEVGVPLAAKLKESCPDAPFKWWSTEGFDAPGVFSLRKPYELKTLRLAAKTQGT